MYVSRGGSALVALDPVTVLIAEDHAVVREGTREMLEHDDLINVIGEAADGATAVSMADELKPDVLLLDMSLPALNGIEVTRRVSEAEHVPGVLILSAYDDVDYVNEALSSGARGYLLKTAGSQEVIAAILAVSRGEVVLHPGVARKVLGGRNETDPDGLSARETEILQLAARGDRTKEIAVALGVSTRTIESHLTSIYSKLGVANRTEAVMEALERGWLRRKPESTGEL